MANLIKGNKMQIFFILFLLLLFHGVNNYIVLTKSRYCSGFDAAVYFDRISRTSQLLKTVKLDLSLFHENYNRIFREAFKPPLFFIVASPFFLFNATKIGASMSNLIWFAILIFATYGIGKKLYDYKVGILSAFLVSMFPIVFALSRVLLVDFALAAMVSLTFYLFLLNKFESFKFSLLVGIIIGLGLLTKQSYFIFLLPILLCFLVRKVNFKNKKIIRNFIFSIILGLLIAATYYVQAHYTYKHVMFKIKNNIAPFFYLQSLLKYQLFLVFFLLFLCGAVLHFWKKKYLLLFNIFILGIVFSISTNKQSRFIIPILSYVAILAAGFVLSLPRPIKIICVKILIIFSFLQYFVISYGTILPISNNPFKKPLLNFYYYSLDDDNGLFSIIDEGDWQTPSEEIIKIVKDDMEKYKVDKRIDVLFIGQSKSFYTSIDCARIIKKLPIEFRYNTTMGFFSSNPWLAKMKIDDRIAQARFIIIQEISPENLWTDTDLFLKAFKRNFSKFEFINDVHFPDNSLCHIYRNREKI